MKTGHWLNLQRNNSFTIQTLSLITVCAVAIPVLTLTLAGAILTQILKE